MHTQDNKQEYPEFSPIRKPVWPLILLAACACALLAGAKIFLAQRPVAMEPGADVFRSFDNKDVVSPKDFSLPAYKALVIGINDYAKHRGSGWSGLTTARTDAEALADVLETEYGFAVERLFDEKATRNAMMAKLDEIVSLTDNDAAVVYFAGHGFFDESRGEGYWIPADARKKAEDRYAREDWIWNSTVTKIISASKARHILVVADSCYAGSLFRGEKNSFASGDLNWYGRAITKPSRYLIASGDLEPVLDSGEDHSAFAQQILSYLKHPEQTVFSASDLGISLRERVGDITGQMVQMGPLALGKHAGGEFVFVRENATANFLAAAPRVARMQGQMRADDSEDAVTPATPAEKEKMIVDALELDRQGAKKTVTSLLASALSRDSEDRLVRAVIEHLDQGRQSKAQDELRTLIATLEQRTKENKPGHQGSPSAARPRIIACLGPSARLSSIEASNTALLYRICLNAELQQIGGMQVIEREAIEQILREMNLGSSSMADPKARLMLGKLLPAGILLLGDILHDGVVEHVYVRLVDTETTRVLASFSEQKKGDEDIASVCRRLAVKVAEKAVEMKPLAAKIAKIDADRFNVNIGRFHGAREDSSFVVVERIPITKGSETDFQEKTVGKATIVQLGETASSFKAEWTADAVPSGSLWIREGGE